MENASGVLLLLLLADPVPSDTCYCVKQQGPPCPLTHALTGLFHGLKSKKNVFMFMSLPLDLNAYQVFDFNLRNK